ncbi:hypothetical protein RCH09_003858 [Actimicrobium sp. GrIS 1.19]|uniref:hypothetical protein n=1 Tax=Actimicrobium sp. GrIS 1.19 TaxID=3071708 RepID=UPI002E09D5FB|nr:hypothetical protein [Actimicrobium sp. GrIS 1.19]
MQVAEIISAVNKRHDTAVLISIPSGVASNDTPLGDVEFALRHESVSLEVLDAAFDKIDPALFVLRLRGEISTNGWY